MDAFQRGIAGGLLLCAGLAAQAAPPPVEAYGRLPAIGSAALSPDGKRVVLAVSYEYKADEPDRELTALSVIDIEAGKANYRGSTVYGYEWFDAGRRGWGDGVMQTDVEDGADVLVKSGQVDPARICIMGASYGGYAALAGATLTPDRYACAVSVNGLSDPEGMLADVQAGGSTSMVAEWWRKSMGADDKEHLRKISPLRHVDDVKIPVLILHGIEDTVVPVEQSRRMSSRLQHAKRNVRYVELGGDDHWLSSASTRTQMLREIETFLAQSLKK